MKIETVEDVYEFIATLQKFLHDNVSPIQIFAFFMEQRYLNNIWMSDSFNGAMFEYTSVTLIEEITEVYTEFKSGNDNHFLEEFGDLFGLYETLRVRNQLQRFPWTPINTIVDPMFVIKKITKMIRFSDDDLWYISDALGSVGEFLRTMLVRKFYTYPELQSYNLIYFVMISSFSKGIRRLAAKFNIDNRVVSNWTDDFINNYYASLKRKGKLSKKAFVNLEDFGRWVRFGKGR
jgi:hypothetical protein